MSTSLSSVTLPLQNTVSYGTGTNITDPTTYTSTATPSGVYLACPVSTPVLTGVNFNHVAGSNTTVNQSYGAVCQALPAGTGLLSLSAAWLPAVKKSTIQASTSIPPNRAKVVCPTNSVMTGVAFAFTASDFSNSNLFTSSEYVSIRCTSLSADGTTMSSVTSAAAVVKQSSVNGIPVLVSCGAGSVAVGISQYPNIVSGAPAYDLVDENSNMECVTLTPPTITSTTTATSDLNIGGSGLTTLSIVGKSGQLKILKAGTTDQYIQLSLDKLQEVDSTGGIQQESFNFAALGKGLQWSAIQSIPAAFGVAGQMTTLTMNSMKFKKRRAKRGRNEGLTYTAGSNFSFVLSVYLFTAAGSYTFADQSWAVTAGQVKLKLDITAFPFLTTTSSLRFGIQMNQSGGADTSLRTKANSAASGTAPAAVAVAVGPGTISIPMYVVLDGKVASSTQNVTVAIPDNNTSDSTEVPSGDKIQTQIYTNLQGGTGLHWTFGYFANTLSFDPTVDTTTTSTTSGYTPVSGVSVNSTYTATTAQTDTGVTTSSDSTSSSNTSLWIGLSVGAGVLVLAICLATAYKVHSRHKKEGKVRIGTRSS